MGKLWYNIWPLQIGHITMKAFSYKTLEAAQKRRVLTSYLAALGALKNYS